MGYPITQFWYFKELQDVDRRVDLAAEEAIFEIEKEHFGIGFEIIGAMLLVKKLCRNVLWNGLKKKDLVLCLFAAISEDRLDDSHQYLQKEYD